MAEKGFSMLTAAMKRSMAKAGKKLSARHLPVKKSSKKGAKAKTSKRKG